MVLPAYRKSVRVVFAFSGLLLFLIYPGPSRLFSFDETISLAYRGQQGYSTNLNLENSNWAFEAAAMRYERSNHEGLAALGYKPFDRVKLLLGSHAGVSSTGTVINPLAGLAIKNSRSGFYFKGSGYFLNSSYFVSAGYYYKLTGDGRYIFHFNYQRSRARLNSSNALLSIDLHRKIKVQPAFDFETLSPQIQVMISPVSGYEMAGGIEYIPGAEYRLRLALSYTTGASKIFSDNTKRATVDLNRLYKSRLEPGYRFSVPAADKKRKKAALPSFAQMLRWQVPAHDALKIARQKNICAGSKKALVILKKHHWVCYQR